MVIAWRRGRAGGGGGPPGAPPHAAEGEMKLYTGNPSASLAAASSPCTGEAVGRGDIKIYTL